MFLVTGLQIILHHRKWERPIRCHDRQFNWGLLNTSQSDKVT